MTSWLKLALLTCHQAARFLGLRPLNDEQCQALENARRN